MLGMSCALPTTQHFTDDYTQYFGEADINKFKAATGINSRYLSNGKQVASDYCYVAARALLDSKQDYLRGGLDALIFFTQYPDYKAPSTAFVLHKRLQLDEKCICFDVNLGCSAFVNAVYIASSMITSGAVNNVLLLIGHGGLEHNISQDKSYTLMFGDAGAAILMGKGEGTIRSVLRSNGEGYQYIVHPAYGERFPHGWHKPDDPDCTKKMMGDEVFIFSITKVPQLFKEFFAENHCSIDDYDYCVLHQANSMIIKTIAKKIKLPPEKMPVSLDRYGNTDGASIPLSIVDLCTREGVKERLRLITSGFGIGLSWGIADFELNKSDVLPPIYTDDYFAEGFEI